MTATSYSFSGHSIGIAAHFTRLDQVENLNHQVPAQGVSALPVTGGLAEAAVANYHFDVDQPRPRTLISVASIRTSASGKKEGTCYRTEIGADIQNITVVDKLTIGRLLMQFLSVRDTADEDADPVVSTNGSAFEDVRLGSVTAQIVVDDEPLRYCGSKNQLAAFYRSRTPEYRRAQSWRFNTGPESADIAEYKNACRWSIVREIRLSGPEAALQDVSVDGYSIYWRGFGRIIFGEYCVKGQDRRLAMVRLAMGSDAAGDGTVGDGQSNGQLGG